MDSGGITVHLEIRRKGEIAHNLVLWSLEQKTDKKGMPAWSAKFFAQRLSTKGGGAELKKETFTRSCLTERHRINAVRICTLVHYE